jgi:hypothetical protein
VGAALDVAVVVVVDALDEPGAAVVPPEQPARAVIRAAANRQRDARMVDPPKK